MHLDELAVIEENAPSTLNDGAVINFEKFWAIGEKIFQLCSVSIAYSQT